MIKTIDISNFKCFDNVSVDLGNLTLLTGENSSGKSTLIQALLLCVNNTGGEQKPLNGYLIDFDSFSEVRNVMKNVRAFEIVVKNEADYKKFTFSDAVEEHEMLRIAENSKKLDTILNFSNGRFHYLSANRIGPQRFYDKSSHKSDRFGINGEFIFSYFEKFKAQPIKNYLVKEGVGNLESQVNYWFDYILNSKLTTEKVAKSNQVRAFYSNNKFEIERKMQPQNVGTGLSYLVGMLIICLASQKDDIIIIENPEIHLHPQAQSLLTEFFAFISDAGINLIIETHSDHILNGVLVQCKKHESGNNGISREKVKVHFFNLNENQISDVHDIEIHKNGRIKNPPNGFFDQIGKDLRTLMSTK